MAEIMQNQQIQHFCYSITSNDLHLQKSYWVVDNIVLNQNVTVASHGTIKNRIKK